MEYGLEYSVFSIGGLDFGGWSLGNWNLDDDNLMGPKGKIKKN